MRIPDRVREEVAGALSRQGGPPVEIITARPIGGGCINPSARIETDGGDAFFLKWNADDPKLFGPETDGLRALAEASVDGGLRVPDVRGVGSGEDGPGWLLLELVSQGRPAPDYGLRLGRGLARLHRPRKDEWGWEADNFIGSLPQANTPRSSWAEFWREERLEPQLERARSAGFLRGNDREWEELFEGMEERVGPAEEEGPSLLHGDLWSGNVYPGPEGEPVIIDPAVYRGHREVDLAMTELFGGFPAGFMESYRDMRPLAPGYEEIRRPLYQLYPLLVHVNLFGAGYVGGVRRALMAALG